ncbi:hypothetical protein GCM10011504_30240 [Siccirubricoccus deserti]|uniref:Cytochrome-c oxidase n=1 Tax=Siccirubricoccus deserti TaxID=2013562 RepID=A0A9X0UHW9_9PROT|nr:hypothetical protein [Siccirubricoccus deserti]MBC4016525.1 hypothetical protein [Siccirubricoccus deserti]GGC49789.1 hypothetical protein GCM10011504_30240 [Siccirubricoccus deserti]
MSRLPVLFLATAALCLVVGVAMGIAMGIAHDFHLAPVHAHLNLLGWTSLSLMGLTYRAYPALEANRVAAVGQFALSAGAAMAFPFGIWLSIEHNQPMLAIAAAVVWFVGALLFLVRLVMLLAPARREAHEPSGMLAAE